MIDSVTRTTTIALDFTKANILSSTPWQGVGDLPRKLVGGYPYTGVNIPALLGQLNDPSSPAIFGSVGQWGNTQAKVKKGSKGIGFIYMKSFKKSDKTISSLKQKDEDLDVSENGRILVPYAAFTAFSQSQMDGYDAGDHHPVLETLKRLQMNDVALIECANDAREAAERYMDTWLQSANANIRTMSEGERSFIVHLAADLVVGFNAGSMELAGILNQRHPTAARKAVEGMIGAHIMRPWGIACDILRQLSPVFDANVMAGIDAAKLKQEEYKKKYAKPEVADMTKSTDHTVIAAAANNVSEVTPEVIQVINVITSLPVAKAANSTPEIEEPELVEFSSNW